MNTTKTTQFTPGLLEMVFHSYGYEIKEVTKTHTATALRPVATIQPQGDRELHYATLFAAAPAMYEALKEWCDYYAAYNPIRDKRIEPFIKLTKAALAQAEGRQA